MTLKPWIDVTIKAALISAAVLIYLDLKAEIRSVRVDLGARIDKLETRIDKLETRIDKLETKVDLLAVRIGRVETKVDEVRGYLKFNVAAPTEDPSPSNMKKQPASPGVN